MGKGGFLILKTNNSDIKKGKDADCVATKLKATFLSDDLKMEFREAQVKSANGQIRPLIKSENILVKEKPGAKSSSSFLQKPAWVTLLILFIGLFVTYIEFAKKKNWQQSTLSLLVNLLSLAGI